MLHLEVQGNVDARFAERMFIYHSRLYDLYRKPIASLAILIDQNTKWRPEIFKKELWDSSMELRFPIIKLIDYRSKINELEVSNNLFAQVILAQLAALDRELPSFKLTTKITLIKRLYQKKWQKDDIINLFIFLDWVIALAVELELKYQEALNVLEEELQVEYMTSFERLGFGKGVQQGMQQGESTFLMHLLKCKFKTIPENYKQQIEVASPDNLLKWGEKVLDCRALEEIFEI